MNRRAKEDDAWGESSSRERVIAARLLGAAKNFNAEVHVTLAQVQAAARAQRTRAGLFPARMMVAMSVAVCLLLMGGVALSRLWFGPVAVAVATAITVPAGATTRVERRGRFRASFRGPGTIELRDHEKAIAFNQGQLVLANDAVAVAVEAGGRHVEIAPASTVTLEVSDRGTLQVGNVIGAAPTIDGKHFEQERQELLQKSSPPTSMGDSAPDVRTLEESTPPAATEAVADESAGSRVVANSRTTERAAPAEVTSTPVRARKNVAGHEVTLLRDALHSLRRRKDPTGALRTLATYDRLYPRGAARNEVAVIRVEALLALGRSTDALKTIEGVAPDALRASPRLRVARGELLAGHRRCQEALTEFAAVLAHSANSDVQARAERGRAACHR